MADTLLDPQLAPPESINGSVAGWGIALAGEEQLLAPIGRTPITIGSGPTCIVRLQESGVRPLHCVITPGDEGPRVRRWAPGVTLNGVEFDEVELAIGDRLRLGDAELVCWGPDGPVDHGATTRGGEQASDEATASQESAVKLRLRMAATRARALRLTATLREERGAAEHASQRAVSAYESKQQRLHTTRVRAGQLVETLRRERQTMQSTLETSSAEIASLHEALASSQSDVEQLSAALREQQEIVEQRSAEQDAQTKELTQHQGLRLAATRSRALTLVAALRSERQENAAARQLSNEQESLVADLTQRFAETVETAEALARERDELASLPEQLDSAQRDLDASEQTIRELEDRVAELVGALEQAHQQLVETSSSQEVAEEAEHQEPSSSSYEEAEHASTAVEEDLATEELATEELVTEELATEELATEQQTPEPSCDDEMLAEEADLSVDAELEEAHEELELPEPETEPIEEELATEQLTPEISCDDDTPAEEAGLPVDVELEETHAEIEQQISEEDQQPGFLLAKITGEDTASQESTGGESFLEKYAHLIPDDEEEEFEEAAEPIEPVAASPESTAVETEECLDSYMQQMMQRLRGESESAESESAEPAAVEPPSEESSVEQLATAELPEEQPLRDLSEIKSSEAPENTTSLGDLRELANESARQAIITADQQQDWDNAVLWFSASGVAIVGGGVAVLTSSGLFDPLLIMGFGGLAGGGWFARRTYQSCRAAREATSAAIRSGREAFSQLNGGASVLASDGLGDPAPGMEGDFDLQPLRSDDGDQIV